MNVDDYEAASAAFTEANKAWNRVKKAWTERKEKPTEAEQLAYDMAELQFHRAEKAHEDAYAKHSAASPDTSEQKMDGVKRVPLTKAELAERDEAQRDAEVKYWPKMGEPGYVEQGGGF